MGQSYDVRARIREVGARYASVPELMVAVVGDATFTLDRAYELMARAGGLDKLVRMTADELMETRGIGKAGAVKLQAALELGRRVFVYSPDERVTVRSPADGANLMMDRLRLLDQEEMWVVLLDTKNRVLSKHMVYRGSLNTSVIRTAELLRPAVRAQAKCIVLFHNHPSGDPTPSPEDVDVTKGVVTAAQLLDIIVLDHIIIGDQRYVSMKERGLGGF